MEQCSEEATFYSQSFIRQKHHFLVTNTAPLPETDGNIGIVWKPSIQFPLVSVSVSIEAFLSLGISPSIDPEDCAFLDGLG